MLGAQNSAVGVQNVKSKLEKQTVSKWDQVPASLQSRVYYFKKKMPRRPLTENVVVTEPKMFTGNAAQLEDKKVFCLQKLISSEDF